MTKNLVVYNAGDWILNTIKEHENILNNFFDLGDKVAIIGKSKSRKSFLAMQLAICLATGRLFIGYTPQKKFKVLIFQFEIRETRYHSRLKKMCNSMGVEGSDLFEWLYVVNARGKEINPNDIISILKERSCQIVIIDPLYKLIDGDENNPAHLKVILSKFDKIAEEASCTVVYVHHDKKGHVNEQDTSDRGAGSGVLGRDFDSSITLSSHNNFDDCIVVESLTRNFPPQNPKCIVWENNFFINSDHIPNKKGKLAGTRRKFNLDNAIEVTIKELEDTFEKQIGKKTLTEKLRDKGIAREQAEAAIEALTEQNKIEIINKKAEKGKSSKIIKLIL